MGWQTMSNTANCLDCGTYTPEHNTVMYIVPDQYRVTTRKDWAIEIIREQPFFAGHYDPKAKDVLEWNRRLRKLHK